MSGQLSLGELPDMMDPFLGGKCGYTTKNLKNKLLGHYGNDIFFNKLPGSNTMLASEKWHKDKNSNPEVEALSAFANDTEIIRSQFCGSVYILGEGTLRYTLILRKHKLCCPQYCCPFK